MTWREIHFGLVNELLDPEAPIAFASDRIGSNLDPNAVPLIAAARDLMDLIEIVARLAQGSPTLHDAAVRRKWLFLVLAWIYEHRHETPDPLQRVEEVYADFGYPAEVASFVRYMPMVGPDLGSREANERRLYDRWRKFIDDVGSTQLR